MDAIPEFEEGQMRGIPGRLPEGETLIWQGAPDMMSFARHALHVRKIGFYFALLLFWQLATGLYDGDSAGAIGAAASFVLLGAGLVIGFVYLYAWLVQRMTVYSLTNKRVVMRIGVALPVAFNLPYAQITSADARGWADGSGSISLAITKVTKISWMILWPHARPMRFAKPEPTLRCIPDMQAAADLLGAQLRKAHGIAATELGSDAVRMARNAKAVQATAAQPGHPANDTADTVANDDHEASAQDRKSA